jgi:hypothetical protein
VTHNAIPSGSSFKPFVISIPARPIPPKIKPASKLPQKAREGNVIGYFFRGFRGRFGISNDPRFSKSINGGINLGWRRNLSSSKRKRDSLESSR